MRSCEWAGHHGEADVMGGAASVGIHLQLAQGPCASVARGANHLFFWRVCLLGKPRPMRLDKACNPL